MCVFVDCDWGKKNQKLSDKFSVEGYPTVVFCDPEGKKVGDLESRSADGVAKQIEGVAAKYAKPSSASFAEAAEAAKDEPKPVLLLFVPAKGGEISPLEAALADPSLKDIVEKFVRARIEIKKEGEDAKRFGVATSTSSVLLAVDPRVEKPEAAPLRKVIGKKTPKELRKELEAALKKYEESTQ
jgi:hypothetical protein